MDFVEDHRAHVVDACPGDKHVSQHLGGHHQNRGVAVDHDVPCQQADLVVNPDGAEVPVLLIGQRLDGRGVDRSRAVLARHEDAKLANDRLSGAGRRGNQDRVTIRKRPNRLELEIVELVRQARGELLDERLGCHGFVGECTVARFSPVCQPPASDATAGASAQDDAEREGSTTNEACSRGRAQKGQNPSQQHRADQQRAAPAKVHAKARQ